MKAFALGALLVPALAWAGSPFDGTWVFKEDTAKQDEKPYVLSLANGVWSNPNVVPPIKVKADGKDQPVTGHAYYDMVVVRSLGPDSVEITYKKGGKVTSTSTFSVSADGKTLTQKWTDLTGTQPVSGQFLLERVGKAPAGEQAVSGSWRALKVVEMSAAGRTVTYQRTADGLSMKSPTGQSYEAKFDGKEYPIVGDPGGTMVSLKSVDANTIVETDKRMGKIVEVDRMTVAADGKSMKFEWEETETHRKGSFVMEKSP